MFAATLSILSHPNITSMHRFQVIKKWGAPNKIDFLSLSYTRHAEDVRQVGN
jgi:hypothetical protein